jgi:recombination protein RecA
VDVDNLIIIQPECQEDMYNMIEPLIRTGKFRLVVIDSHTAALCRKRIEGEVGETVMAVEARNNSTALGKIKPLLKSNRCTVIGVSQLRADIGGYGDPNKPTGGNAWKFYTDIRYKVSKEINKDKEANKTTITVIKNKCARPFGVAIFNINWGTGVDRQQEIVDFAVAFKILEKGGGGWYTVCPGGEGDGTKIQGDDKLKEFLADNPEYALEIERQVLTKIAEE